jgi:hypothetical protein
MTINLFFSAQRKIIRFSIEGKVVRYYDDNWKEGIQILPSQTPKMKLMLRKMITSRKSTLQAMAQLIVDANSGKNKEDYDNCKTDEEVAGMIEKDCLLKGLVKIKEIAYA